MDLDYGFTHCLYALKVRIYMLALLGQLPLFFPFFSFFFSSSLVADARSMHSRYLCTCLSQCRHTGIWRGYGGNRPEKSRLASGKGYRERRRRRKGSLFFFDLYCFSTGFMCSCFLKRLDRAQQPGDPRASYQYHSFLSFSWTFRHAHAAQRPTAGGG